MFKVIYEVEICGHSGDPTYLYIEADEDISIDMGDEHGDITHISTIDKDCGVTPDLVIKKEA